MTETVFLQLHVATARLLRYQVGDPPPLFFTPILFLNLLRYITHQNVYHMIGLSRQARDKHKSR